jgi:hypothetical protein
MNHDRIEAAARRLHHGAEANHRTYGHAALALVLLPEDEPASLIMLPAGIPDPAGAALLAAYAARLGATAGILAGEVWIAVPGLSAEVLLALPDQDVPRPAEFEDKREAILTTASWPAAGSVTRLVTMIERTALGTTLRPGPCPAGLDLGAAAFLAALLPPGPDPAQRPPAGSLR